MNVGTTPDEKFITIGVVNEYSWDQGEIIDYSSLHKVECSTQLEMKALEKDRLLRGIGERNCWKGRWNPIDRVSYELPNQVDTLKDQRQNRVWNPRGRKLFETCGCHIITEK